MSTDDAETRSELERVEQLIASLTKQDRHAEETPDGADAASGLTQAAEDEAVLEQLRNRRDRLRARLEEG
ncbi:hypothetical protein [Aeromicrobium sp.]|uniref:hypothetical protein n=1 Tax=Aeromicrobium sp. TaxID=1871063 RepID=UPI003D6AD83A